MEWLSDIRNVVHADSPGSKGVKVGQISPVFLFVGMDALCTR